MCSCNLFYLSMLSKEYTMIECGNIYPFTVFYLMKRRYISIIHCFYRIRLTVLGING